MSTPAVVHSFVGKGTLWHQELCESRLRCFLCDFEQMTNLSEFVFSSVNEDSGRRRMWNI